MEQIRLEDDTSMHDEEITSPILMRIQIACSHIITLLDSSIMVTEHSEEG